jgi:Raf kinase inhibitor-like YbhB/YbcL family protein
MTPPMPRQDTKRKRGDVMRLRGLILAVTVALAGLGASRGALAQGAFTLSSPDFKDGERMPLKNAGNRKESSNCVGQNISPALNWANPPSGTQSFAIMMVDPEARPPNGVIHWVVYGIPVSATGLAEGEMSKPSDKYVGGLGTDKLIYSGPCPPPGAPHHYVFTLIATDLKPSALQSGLTREDLVRALAGHSKRAAGLVGTFSKP